MGFIDGDAAWYAQEMARRAANRAAEQAAREQERIDRERYESSNRSGYGSWAKGPAPSGNPFARATLDEIKQDRDMYARQLEEAEIAGDRSLAYQMRGLVEIANQEIDRRNNFDVLSKTERAEIERLASKQNEELRKERDALEDRVHERNQRINEAYDKVSRLRKDLKQTKEDLSASREELKETRSALDEAQKLIEELREQIERLEAAGSSTDGQNLTVASS